VTSSLDVIVIGAGVLGLASAAELAARGHVVSVIDPGEENASTVAAGMIAPAMESALDDLSLDVVAVLTAARRLWPDFARRHGLRLIEDGAEWRGQGGEEVARRLHALAWESEITEDRVATPHDARIEPAEALSHLASRVGVVTGRAMEAQRAERGWSVVLDDGRKLSADRLVVATGAGPALKGLPPKVAALIARIQPIRGQLAEVDGAGPALTVRTAAGYAVPSAGGMVVGASMEPGVRDLEPDPEAAARQVRAVCEEADLAEGSIRPRVGVRGALPDRLPAAGRLEGVAVALAPRRNGWLLAPLVARVVADALEGRPSEPWAAALAPDRPGLDLDSPHRRRAKRVNSGGSDPSAPAG
jgi:glycine oxidase